MPTHRLTSNLSAWRSRAPRRRSALLATVGLSSALVAATFLASSPARAAEPVPANVTTTVYDASSHAAWAGSETTGASANDTAIVSVSGTPTPIGTVTYSFFDNGACSGTAASTDTVTLSSSGAVPDSSSTAALAAGSYSYGASYSGDSTYGGASAKCEPFTVAQAATTASTTVYDASTKGPWSGSEVAGASGYDTALLSGTVAGFTPSGTVTYSFFDNGACSGTAASTDTVTLSSSGAVPDSSSTSALAVGTYGYSATYSGDGNYTGSSGKCEAFTVSSASTSSSTTTAVYDASTSQPWTNTEVTGASAYDTAVVTVSGTAAATGTLTYSFFGNGSCSGTPVATDTVTLSSTGTVPHSSASGALAAGVYAYDAAYSGDSNHSGSSSSCESFSLAKASTTTSTVVYNACTKAPWANSHQGGYGQGGNGSRQYQGGNGQQGGCGSKRGGWGQSGQVWQGGHQHWNGGGGQQQNTSAYDSATVVGVPGFTPTGTLTYEFFENGTCQGAATTSDIVTLSGGTVPPSAVTGSLSQGNYSFLATYNGDSNYLASTAPCEPFKVGQGGGHGCGGGGRHGGGYQLSGWQGRSTRH